MIHIQEIAESIRGFFVGDAAYDKDEYIALTYAIVTEAPAVEAAAHLCQEQSTAQYSRVGIDEDFRPEFASKVVDIRKASVEDLLCGDVENFDTEHTYIVNSIYPICNFGSSIPNMLTSICGEGVFHCPHINHIKLLDIEFPNVYLQDFQGPRFGEEGIRKMLGIYDRPLMLGVVKPNIGLPPEPFADLAYEAWFGGLDIAKDDELLCDTKNSPFSQRSRLLGEMRLKVEEKTGQKKMYLANITDEVDRMPELYKEAVENHVNAVMVNGMTTGLSAVRMLSKIGKIPLFSHFDFIAPITSNPLNGVHLQVIIKLHRLAGYDCVIYQGLGDRMRTSKDEVLLSYEACTKPMGHLKPVLAVPAGSQWAGSLKNLYEMFNSPNFGIVPGRAVFNHSMGPGAGAAALLQGWDAVIAGETLEEYAKTREELAVAIDDVKRLGR